MGSNNGKALLHYTVDLLLESVGHLKKSMGRFLFLSSVQWYRRLYPCYVWMWNTEEIIWGSQEIYCAWLVVVLITIDTGSSNDCNECHQCSIVARWLIIIWDLPHNRQYRHIVCLYCCAISQGYIKRKNKITYLNNIFFEILTIR